ncbi:hypothetical protein [Natrinema sp. SYSU A 869]|uniref:hypothetical protein n=1 Tax=Natrinema sp. SYSU A 869 TaxID=2871694 RepID=UPI0021073BDF|nr:hypothetical protein [Natrinema sp. SYSU A 869]
MAADCGCNVVVEGEVDLSQTVANELAQRIGAAGKPAVILYLADFDVKGYGMPANMAGKLAWLHQRGDLEQRVVIERLAVTTEQIEALELPRKPIETSSATGTGGVAYNRRITEWEQQHGAGATELNALEQHPDKFRRIVRLGKLLNLCIYTLVTVLWTDGASYDDRGASVRHCSQAVSDERRLATLDDT